MRIGRSTFYDTPDAGARDLTIVAEMKTICDEFDSIDNSPGGFLSTDDSRLRGALPRADSRVPRCSS